MKDRDVSSYMLSRRQFLTAALGASSATILGCSTAPPSTSTIRKAASIKPAGSDLGAIEHVIFFMQENRSFDHYYGAFPGVRGFDDHPSNSLGAFSQSYPANTTDSPIGRLLPFHLSANSGIGECTHDLNHGWPAQHGCRGASGLNEDFVKVHTSPSVDGPTYGTLTMGHYNAQDLPYYYALASAFTICDNYHCSVIGPTDPNRLMALSGTIDPDGKAGGPVITTSFNTDVIWSVNWETMPEVLQDAGISWKVYTPEGSLYTPASFTKLGLLGDAILPYFSQYKNPSSQLYQKAFLPLYPTDFVNDIKNDTLPQVSWIIPPIGYDEHPPAPPALGEWLTDQILSALVSNPQVWAKTALFHMYDENDGFFDHVPPPVAPPGTPGEYLTVNPLPSTANGISGPVGLGFRVPMIVISPFSRGGYVASDIYDHTSQLRFLEERFGVKAPNISDWRRKTVGDLTGTLHMNHSDLSSPPLPSTSNDTKATVFAQGCQVSDLLELRTDQPPVPIPNPQSMPVQEPGIAKRITTA